MEESKLPCWLLLNAGYELVRTEWNYRNVCSPFTRLYYVTEGHGRIVTKAGVIEMRPGYMYMVPAFMEHSNECDSFMGHYYIHIYEYEPSPITDRWNFPAGLAASDCDRMVFERIVAENPSASLSETDPRLYDNNDMLAYTISSVRRRSLASRVMTSGLVSILMSRWISEGQPADEVTHPGVAEAMLQVRRDIAGRHSTSEMARVARLSDDHFIRLFRKETGMTPQQYVVRQRMRVAQTRLVTERTSVKAIAIDLGYDDCNYFIRQFRRHVGTTPAGYRKAVAGENHR